MITLLGTVATAVVLLILLAGCAAHLTRPTALPDALHAHGVLPERAVRLAAGATVLAEGLLGAAGTAALLGRQRPALAAVLGASAVLFTCYALYTRHALATGRGGPCGCSRADVPLSGWVVGRAWTFAALALGAAVLVAGPATPPTGPAEVATATLVALAFAVLLWVLPAAMTQPGASVTAVRTDRTDRTVRTVRTAGAVTAPRGGHRAWTS